MDKEKKVEFEINRTITYQPCFETNSSLMSRIFFLWTHELIRRGNQKHLDLEDLSDLKQTEEPLYSYERFSKIFYGLAVDTPKKIFTSFKKYLGKLFIISGILATLGNLLQFSGPIMINNVLEFLADSSNPDIVDKPPLSEGILYVSILLLCYLLRTIIMQHSMHYVNLNCYQVLNSSNSLIYHKILKLSSASRKYLETGSIMNYINVDTMAFYFFIMMSTFLFSAPFMILTAIVLLIIEVGWIGLVAPLLFAFGMFAQQKIMKKGFQLRKDSLFWTDKRSKAVNEYFSGIRIIKYYGWEELVAEKIQNIRKNELQLNFKTLMIRTYVEVLMNMLPIFSSIVIFAVYAADEGEEKLTPAKVYTVLSIFNLIATPMRLIIITLINLINAQASLSRIQHFFGYEEKNEDGFDINCSELQDGEIEFDNCKFNWTNSRVEKHFEDGKELYNKTPAQKVKDQKSKEDQKEKQKVPNTEEVKPKKKKKKRNKMVLEGEEVEVKPMKKKKKKSPKVESSSLLSQQNSLMSSLLDESSKESGKSSKAGRSKKEQQEDTALVIENLKISKGSFVGIVGRVGSGKSTFLYSILGEIDKISGTVNRRGSTAYIPQTSWLRSATIRQNIVFQGVFDEAKYQKILKICELETDLQILGGGDMTEIGEKGVNLSGGQKQRISIARALYADADIYLVDDCLSALDSYVGKSIFNNVLTKYLHENGKTIIFVTNAIDYTQSCDRVIVMNRGRIQQDDSPDQLNQNLESAYSLLKNNYKKSVEEKKEEKTKQEEMVKLQKKKSKDEIDLEVLDKEDDKTEASKEQSKKKEIEGLVKVEERLKGSVPWKFYYRFFTGPGGFTTTMMFSSITLAQLVRVFSDWWLGEWSNNKLDLEQNQYIEVYGIISLVVGILMFLKGRFFANFIIGTSRVIQRTFIRTLLKSPLSWFDVTPTGRILARATKDQDDLDNSLAFNVQFATQSLFTLFSSLVLISVATPVYLIVAVISGFIYFKLIGLYMASSREIKRIEANNRAPLISHIQETINGTYVIRAFNKTEQFSNSFFVRQKSYIVALTNQNIATRWISLVTDLMSVVTIATAGYLGVITTVADVGTNSTNLIGLSLVWSLQISSIMSFTLRILADTESNMNAVVRLYEYVDNNPSEASFDEKVPDHPNWPADGQYDIKNISYKYRPELPNVIKDISFDVKSKSKIGIVGRTGSGKSTMTLGFLRILQIATNQDNSKGKISLDKQDLSEVGLHHLRHNVTIIPQDPTLFTGTIKENIDPFGKYTEEEVAESLKKVSLWDQIKDDPEKTTELSKKVYSKVEDGGANFSLGQKQLMCMARALIRHPTVLLMDEATASIDQATDELIQNMIRTQFTETTVITIAHRLNTIIFYDKILVLDHGQVKEYDTPLNLVRNENSFLGSLIRKTGKNYADKIISMAENNLAHKQ